MARGSQSSKPGGASKSETRSQESENDSGIEVDVTPDEISIDAGAFEIGVDAEGEVSIGIEIPTPVPGITATGGIVIDTKTGEIVEVSLGAEFGQVTGFDVTLSGCNVITTFYVEIPNTNIRFSYSVISELPDCKIDEPPEEPEEPEDPLMPLDEEKTKELIDKLDEERKKIPLGCSWYMEFGGRKFLKVPPPNLVYSEYENQTASAGPAIGMTSGSGTGDFEILGPYHSAYPQFREWIATIVEVVAFNNGVRSGRRSANSIAELFARIATYREQRVFGLDDFFSTCDFAPDLTKKPRLPPPSSPPPPPEKMDKCCRESLILLDEIHKALGCSELLDKKSKTGGFEVPRRLLAPGGKGELKHYDYLGIFESVIRIQDNLGFHPFRVKIDDTNAAKAGNQGVDFQFLSLSAALEKILYLLIDTEEDGDVQTNMLVRLAFTCVNILTTLATTSRDVETIRDGLGVSFKPKKESVDTAFDVSCGQNSVGFDPKTKQEIDLNEEKSTEQLLPFLLKTKKHQVRTTEFDDKDDIKDLLIKILYSLKTGN